MKFWKSNSGDGDESKKPDPSKAINLGRAKRSDSFSEQPKQLRKFFGREVKEEEQKGDYAVCDDWGKALRALKDSGVDVENPGINPDDYTFYG